MPRTLKRTYSAPAERAKRAAAASKIQKAARGRGLTAKRATSISNVKAMKAARSMYTTATNAVMDMKEEKWFDVSGDLQKFPEAPTEGPKRVSVMAFATTSNLVPGTTTGVVETYCGHEIKNLNMLRPFHTTTATGAATAADLLPNMIEGKHVYPTYNSVSWQINRNYAIVGPKDSTAASGVLTNLKNALAVRCRLIRVTPKLAPGITTAIAPTEDLFLDQHGQPYSPSDSQFSYSDAEYASVNRRKYSVLQDSKFTLTQPLTQQWTPQLFSGGSGNTNLCGLIPSPKGSHTKKMVTRHKLCAKKDGRVRYNDPASQVNATDGLRREYVFMHFWYENSDGGAAPPAANIPPTIGTDNVVPDSQTIKVHWRVESRFKEA